MRSRSFSTALRLLFLLLMQPLAAQVISDPPLTNLTLTNFFTDGWDQPWAKRPNPGGAPDLALLRVATNFLARDYRTDFFSEQTLNSTKNRTINLLDGSLSYGLDRRIMILATGYYE